MTDIKITASPYGTWEYVPSGGCVLTAEQMEDVRLLVEYAGGMPHEAKIRLKRAALRVVDAVGYPNAYLVQQLRESLYEVDALLRATEPAEDGWGDVNPDDPKGRTYRETAEEYYSAPAVPAEEETKAEVVDGCTCWPEDRTPDCYTSSPVVPAPTETSAIGQAAIALRAALDVVDPLEDGDWEHAWRTVEDLEDCAKRAETIAPNETGPWQTLAAVPADIHKVRDRHGDKYRRRKGGGWSYRTLSRHWVELENPKGYDQFAPFVAAKEGDA